MTLQREEVTTELSEDQHDCAYCQRVLVRTVGGIFVHDNVPHPNGYPNQGEPS